MTLLRISHKRLLLLQRQSKVLSTSIELPILLDLVVLGPNTIDRGVRFYRNVHE
jgi:hypothetical protein